MPREFSLEKQFNPEPRENKSAVVDNLFTLFRENPAATQNILPPNLVKNTAYAVGVLGLVLFGYLPRLNVENKPAMRAAASLAAGASEEWSATVERAGEFLHTPAGEKIKHDWERQIPSSATDRAAVEASFFTKIGDALSLGEVAAAKEKITETKLAELVRHDLVKGIEKYRETSDLNAEHVADIFAAAIREAAIKEPLKVLGAVAPLKKFYDTLKPIEKARYWWLFSDQDIKDALFAAINSIQNQKNELLRDHRPRLLEIWRQTKPLVTDKFLEKHAANRSDNLGDQAANLWRGFGVELEK